MSARRELFGEHGTVLVFALLILVVGATILGGVAQLAVTQSIAGQTEWDAAARRMQIDNSRALARQYILSCMWRDYGALAPGSLASGATGGAGGFAITNAEPEFGYWLSLDRDGTNRINPFNIFERGGFQSAWVTGSLDAGATSVPWGFQIRTRSPITAGFAFVNHRPAGNVWSPARRINMQQPDYATGFADLPRMPVSSVTNTNTGDASGFAGYLLLPKAEARFGTLPAVVGGVDSEIIPFSDPLSARITADLEDAGYYVTPGGDESNFYEVPSAMDVPTVSGGVTNTNYNVPVTELVLRGGASSTPMQILISEANTNLSTVTLSGSSTRVLYLYRKGDAKNLVLRTGGGNLRWRIGMTLDCETSLEIAGQLAVVGGVRTGRGFVQNSANAPEFITETAADAKYEAIADRMMWLEDQRTR